MGHDSSKVLMGSHGSSDFVASCETGDPATFLAGLIVHRNSSGALSLASADGSKIGVSMGISLSDTSKTSVCRSGNLIPVQITDETGFDYVVIGQPVESSATTGKAVSDGNATGAIYVSGPMTGIDPITGDEIDVALIDMAGGL